MAQRNFDSCQYGPMELRRLLRHRLLGEESIVGWGVVARSPSLLYWWLTGAAVALPAFNSLASEAVMIVSRRMMILTDRRLLVLQVGRRGAHALGGGVLTDVPLHGLLVAPMRRPRGFRMATADDPGTWITFAVLDEHGRTAQRLVQGLRILAEGHGPGDGAG